MLTIRENNFRNEEQYITIDSLVQKNHLVRKIENTIDFEFIYDEVKGLYSPLSAPSINPVTLIKIMKEDLNTQIYLILYLKRY